MPSNLKPGDDGCTGCIIAHLTEDPTFTCDFCGKHWRLDEGVWVVAEAM